MRHLPTLFLFALLPLAAQPPQEGGAPPQAKNLKILKPEDVRQKMGTYTSALGVRCDFCHVAGDRASDANPHKEIARKMIALTQQVNAAFPEPARERVTCYTCHRGESEPKTAPALPAVPAALAPGLAAPAAPPAAAQ